MMLLSVCGTIADCDDYGSIASWGEETLTYRRGFLPFYHGVPGARRLTIIMNRINRALFSTCFTAWVRARWPDLVAIDGLKGAIVTIDDIACNATVAEAVTAASADSLPAVKANQPNLRKEIGPSSPTPRQRSTAPKTPAKIPARAMAASSSASSRWPTRSADSTGHDAFPVNSASLASPA